MKGKIAVLGGGNGGYSSSVDLTLKGHEVSWFSFSAERVEAFNKKGNTIEYEGFFGEGRCQAARISCDLAEVVKDAMLIMLHVPGPGHEKYARALAPHLAPGALVFMNPGHSGGALHMAKMLGDFGAPKDVVVAESNTLSYISRVTPEGRIKITSADKPVLVGVFPNREKRRAMSLINFFYPRMLPAENVIESTLCNINAVFHPAGTLLNAGWVEHTKGGFKFYYEGITPSIGRLIDRMDAERLRVGEAFGLKLKPFPELFLEAGSTTQKGADSGSTYVACQESEANKFINAPQSLDHRYVHEDVCSGILPMSCLGRIVGVDTSIMDALIVIAEGLMDIPYRRTGVNLDKMGLTGMSGERVLEFVEQGF